VDSARRTVARVGTASGEVVDVPEGSRLVFGRGPDADLTIPAGRGLSRRAGVITGTDGGVLVANISRTHALYAVGEDYRIRLPRLESGSEPVGEWFVRSGVVQVGSRGMLDEGKPLRVVVLASGDTGVVEGSPGGPGVVEGSLGDSGVVEGSHDDSGVVEGSLDESGVVEGSLDEAPEPDVDPTLLPLRLDPDTKLFLVALMWCRPWLTDPTRTTPLPRTPEIARAALEVTGAHYELERFDTDPAFRDRLAARVGEHLKVLRHKIAERGLVRPGVRLSDEVVAEVLVEHAVITAGDLARLEDPSWCTRQEDLWWTGER
jgi:hypothetical protein